MNRVNLSKVWLKVGVADRSMHTQEIVVKVWKGLCLIMVEIFRCMRCRLKFLRA